MRGELLRFLVLLTLAALLTAGLRRLTAPQQSPRYPEALHAPNYR